MAHPITETLVIKITVMVTPETKATTITDNPTAIRNKTMVMVVHQTDTNLRGMVMVLHKTMVIVIMITMTMVAELKAEIGGVIGIDLKLPLKNKWLQPWYSPVIFGYP
jgi:hypothetical protein